MSVNAGPYALTPGQSVTVKTPDANPARYPAAVLQNVSPYALQVGIGTYQRWIAPSCEAVVPASLSGQSLTVTPVSLAALPAIAAELLVTWLEPEEVDPAQPDQVTIGAPAVSISGGTVTATITSGSVTISSGTVNIGANAPSATVLAKTALANGANTFNNQPAAGLGAGLHTLIVTVFGTKVTQLSITGSTSSTPWLSLTAPGGTLANLAPGVYLVPFDSGIDSQVNIAATTSATGSSLQVAAVADSLAVDPRSVGLPGGVMPAGVMAVGGQIFSTTGFSRGLIAFAADENGQQYVVPAPPSAAAADHPQNDLSIAAAGTSTAGGTILAAPGAGKRYRVFQLYAAPQASPTTAYVVGVDGLASAEVILAVTKTTGVDTNTSLSGYPSGIPQAATNTALTNHATLGNGWTFVVVYTTETA